MSNDEYDFQCSACMRTVSSIDEICPHCGESFDEEGVSVSPLELQPPTVSLKNFPGLCRKGGLPKPCLIVNEEVTKDFRDMSRVFKWGFALAGIVSLVICLSWFVWGFSESRILFFVVSAVVFLSCFQSGKGKIVIDLLKRELTYSPTGRFDGDYAKTEKHAFDLIESLATDCTCQLTWNGKVVLHAVIAVCHDGRTIRITNWNTDSFESVDSLCSQLSKFCKILHFPGLPGQRLKIRYKRSQLSLSRTRAQISDFRLF